MRAFGEKRKPNWTEQGNPKAEVVSLPTGAPSAARKKVLLSVFSKVTSTTPYLVSAGLGPVDNLRQLVENSFCLGKPMP